MMANHISYPGMKIKLAALVCCFVCCSDYSIVRAGEKITVSSGGALRSEGVVKVVGIGLPYIRRRSKAVKRHSAATQIKVAVSTVDSMFRLGEVYVYPNPAKGGQIPTFHIEVGVADSVKITVYSVAGEVAHNHTITGLPSVINDGNGLEYSYEYAWRGHIPSGVYYFTIEAQKSGKKTRKTGKFAVVR